MPERVTMNRQVYFTYLLRLSFAITLRSFPVNECKSVASSNARSSRLLSVRNDNTSRDLISDKMDQHFRMKFKPARVRSWLNNKIVLATNHRGISEIQIVHLGIK